MLRDPLVGGLFENLVVSEAMKWRCNGRRPENFYFFRDSNGLEVDLVMEAARRLHLVEVKCAMTPNPSLERGIVALTKMGLSWGLSLKFWPGDVNLERHFEFSENATF